MGIEAATASVTTTAQTTVNTTSSSAKANSSDASFKDEMSKVTNAKDESKTSKKEQDKASNEKKIDSKKDEITSSTKNEDKSASLLISENADKMQSQNIIDSSVAINNAGMMLSNDIAQMFQNTFTNNDEALKIWTVSVNNGKTSNIKMNESDADFFIQLTQNENINVQAVSAQAQNMVNHGAEFSEVKQNVQVSQALLSALSEARENNQPIRIDFDQNISVILRVGRDGAVSAQFIPGDKAVEQYLRNNIESLRASFDEQDLPYSELSYSNSSKEQNQRRRQEKQQGE